MINNENNNSAQGGEFNALDSLSKESISRSTKSTPERAKGINRKSFSEDLTLTELAQYFSTLDQKGFDATLIPIGFPAAGKSMWLSSLLWYAQKGGAPFSQDVLDSEFFKEGSIALRNMVDSFSADGALYQATAKGTLDLIGIDITPYKTSVPPIRLAFLDLAGEDVKNIDTLNGGEFTAKIDAVLNGLQINNSPVIFVLITPFNPAKYSTDSRVSESEGHHREDALHYSFLNYLEQHQPNLMASSKIFMIVSQWDKNPNPNLSVEDYIRLNRSSVYNYIQNKDVIYGQYSVGRILSQKEQSGETSQRIASRDTFHPYKFWKETYMQITGKDLDKKPWWQRLFS
ncbi:hypothetical protein U8695_07440 [Aquirufa antheringensis]